MHPDQTLEALILGWDLGRFFPMALRAINPTVANRGSVSGS